MSFLIWNFHSRLKITNPGPCLVFLRLERGSDWKKHSRLKISFRIESLMLPMSHFDFFFQSWGRLGMVWRKRNGIQKTIWNVSENIAFPPAPVTNPSEKRPAWAKCFYLQYIHASLRSAHDCPVRHLCAKSHVSLDILAEAQNASCAITRQSLAKYYN